MKYIVCILLLFAVLACDNVQESTFNSSQYEPILISRTELKKQIAIEGPHKIASGSRIYVYENMVFVVDKGNGIHIVDNSNPQSPQNTSYLKLIGCTDIAIRNGNLYANNLVDLVTFRINGLNDIREISRIENAFDEPLDPNGNLIPDQFKSKNRPANTVIWKWEKAGDNR